LQEIPEDVKNQLEIVPVKWIDRVFEIALETAPQPLSDEEAAAKPAEPASATTTAPTVPPGGDILTH